MDLNMFINGEWVKSKSNKRREIINPFNQEVIAFAEEGDIEDAKSAIRCARDTFDNTDWSILPGCERGKILLKLANLIELHKEELARLETLNTGKTIVESEADMDGISDVFRYFGGLADKCQGEVISSPIENTESLIVREPIGVCSMITPWNYPLLQASWKIAPALAAGCTMVIKPSELTPVTTLKLAELIEDAGVPAGVFNIVTGDGENVGNELAESYLVDFVSFTGGIVTGKKVMEKAARSVKKVALELGGKNPNIVFEDSDLETALDFALNAVFFHAGQVCSAGSRLLLEESIHDDFVNELVSRVKDIKLGDGFKDSTRMGPVISLEHRKKIEDYIELGKEEGANLLIGGSRPKEEDLQKGFFIEPTIFTGCKSNMRIVQEEIFGPVITVEKFQTEEEAIKLANDTIFGLAGAVWTSDSNRARRVSRSLRMGTVWVNDFHPYFPQAPWGGYKQSGIGRELGRSGLAEFMEEKHIFTNLSPSPQNWF